MEYIMLFLAVLLCVYLWKSKPAFKEIRCLKCNGIYFEKDSWPTKAGWLHFYYGLDGLCFSCFKIEYDKETDEAIKLFRKTQLEAKNARKSCKKIKTLSEASRHLKLVP